MMKTRSTYLESFLFIFLLSTLCQVSMADENWSVYISGRKPLKGEEPFLGQKPWTQVRGSSNPAGTFSISLGPNQQFYLGIPNVVGLSHQKVLTIVISGAGSEKLKPLRSSGQYGTGGKKTTKGKIFKPNAAERKKYPGANIIKIYYPKQPAWEWVCISNKGPGGSFTFTINKAYTHCNKRGRKPEFHDFYVQRGYFGGVVIVGSMSITEIWNFPKNATVNTSLAPTFTADPSTGNWTSDFVFTDPDGDPRPQGGVRFSSDGTGLDGGDEYYYEFAMLGGCDKEFELYTYEALGDEFYPQSVHIYPIIRQWQSFRDHLGVPMSIDLDTGFDSNGEDGPAVETRQGGINQITVEFDRSVVLLNPAEITVTDSINNIYAPDAIGLQNDDTQLIMDFDPNLPQGCYTVDLNNSIEDLYGDNYCQVRSLVGDVSGDGIVNADDENLMNAAIGMPFEAQYDLNLDSVINSADLGILTNNDEQFVFCAEAHPYMKADTSGPDGESDYHVDLYDFQEMCKRWLACNDPLDVACSP